MKTYNDLLLEVKMFLNKELYEHKLISFKEFTSVENTLLERMTS